MIEILVGGHITFKGGASNIFANADEIGANFVQVFTQSPRMWRSAPVDDDDAREFREGCISDSSNLRGLVTHASYLINLASHDPDLLEKSRLALISNLDSAAKLGARGAVLHVGSHKGSGFESVLNQVVSSLLYALDSTRGDCKIFIENTAGQGGSIGSTFEEIAALFDAAGGDERLGFCLDTQHLFATGRSYGSVVEADIVLDDLARTIGLERLGCIHLNDSKVPLGSFRDRHENLGEGFIGDDALACLISSPKLVRVPIILEVPGDGKGPRRSDVDKARRLVISGKAARGVQD